MESILLLGLGIFRVKNRIKMLGLANFNYIVNEGSKAFGFRHDKVQLSAFVKR